MSELSPDDVVAGCRLGVDWRESGIDLLIGRPTLDKLLASNGPEHIRCEYGDGKILYLILWEDWKDWFGNAAQDPA